MESTAAEPQKSTDVAAPTPGPSTTVSDMEFWSASRIAEKADSITAQLGIERNLMARTLFVALDGTHFLPVRTYSALVLARRALVGMGMMMVVSLAPIEGKLNIDYKFEIGFARESDRLVEVWNVCVADNVIARFLLAPAETVETDLVKKTADVVVFALKPKE